MSSTIRNTKGCPLHIKQAKYGCLKNSFAEFTSAGGIIPINGYITWFNDTFKQSDSLPSKDILSGIQSSLTLIEPYMGKVKFKQVFSREESQITIGFYKNNDPDLPSPFSSNTLAYAFLGNGTTAFNIVGDVYFNDENFNWTLGATNTTVDFIKIATHEFLHSLGLSHQTFDSNGILFPSYNPNVPIKFTQDTIDGLEFIYGKFDGPTDTEPEIPPADGPADDVPNGCLAILAKIFPTKKKLNKVNEPELVILANELGIKATTKARKSFTLDKVYKLLHP